MYKFISSFVAVVIVFSVFSTVTKAQSFSDVPEDHHFYEEITYLAEQNIISGFQDNTFRPNKVVSRAEAAVMIGRILGLDGTPTDTPYWDVTEETFGSGYINETTKAGVFQGLYGGIFRPWSALTRGDASIVIDRTFTLELEQEIPFTDVSPFSRAYPYIKKTFAHGIMVGYTDNTFRPYSGVTRGEFAAILTRALPYLQ
ncbi:S-layer homology domain-containing protein [Bacillus litorisediminis]|uniref:S-layer homology domain-containing protein n=1 Tax=Bacillus litorisediminis TaxID=2922713 RepID=UPI001FACB88C|nr:S-layer homology domain-containing protein [Bacillus litorisediminis]